MLRTSRCKLDESPFRAEIEYLYKKKVPTTEIAKKYASIMGIAEITLAIKIKNHVERQHPPMLDVTPVTQEDAEKRLNGNFNDYAGELLKIGMLPDMLSTRKVTHSNIISAQRTLLEEKKINGQIDAQKLMMLKFFRRAGEVIEGEVVDGSNELSGGEDLHPDTD